MIIEFYDATTGTRLRVPATQLTVYNNQQTPIMVAAEFGTDRSQRISKVGDDDFIPTLRAVGFNGGVVAEELRLPSNSEHGS